jgi:hypothetical protein
MRALIQFHTGQDETPAQKAAHLKQMGATLSVGGPVCVDRRRRTWTVVADLTDAALSKIRSSGFTVYPDLVIDSVG